MDWETVVIPSDPSSMEVVERRILSRIEERGLTERRFFAVRLVLEEAVANAIQHGNKLDPAKKVTIRFRIEPKRVIFEVNDEGAGFKVDAVPDPTDDAHINLPQGRGILLMRAYADEVRYGEKGNQVHLVVHLDEDPVREECR